MYIAIIQINPTSEKLQRTIDDLYYWQDKMNDKKNKKIEEKNKVTFT
jgi:hypothetical protein